MKAIRIHQWGGPEMLRHEDAPKPTPGPGEVLVRVCAAGVNPVDWKVREGYLEDFLPHTLPLIPGWDVSGVVEALGADVTGFTPGEEVYGNGNVARNGAYAQWMAISAGALARKPRHISHVDAASLPIAALTAWQSLFEAAHLQADQTVLIHAAAGGVGSIAVQLAKWKGARVIGTASAPNHEYVRSLGADDVIDYTRVRFEEVVRDVDVVFDTVGRETQARSWQVLKPGGFLAAIVSTPDPEEARRFGVGTEYIFTRPDPDGLEQIAALVDVGQIKPQVFDVFPLSDAGQAHAKSETRHTRGKIVLQVAD